MSLPTITVPTYNITVPSTKQKVKYRPYLVKEEKILLMALESEDYGQIADALEQVVSDCVQTSTFDVSKLASFDIEYLFVNIRAKSVGEIVDLIVPSPDDEETKIPFQINIEKVKVQFQKNNQKIIKLSDDLWVEMRYLSIHDYLINGENELEFMASGIEKLYNSERVWDNATTTKEEFVSFLENLTKQQFVSVREFFETVPALRHTVKLKNPKTGYEFDYTMSGMLDFFA
jgi:hypothetical protein